MTGSKWLDGYIDCILELFDDGQPHDVPLLVTELTAQVYHCELRTQFHPQTVDAEDAYVGVVVLHPLLSTLRDI